MIGLLATLSSDCCSVVNAAVSSWCQSLKLHDVHCTQQNVGKSLLLYHSFVTFHCSNHCSSLLWCVSLTTGPLSNAASHDISSNVDSLTLAPVSTATTSVGTLTHMSVNSGSTASLPAASTGLQAARPTAAVSSDLISLATTSTASPEAAAAAGGVSTSAGSTGNASLFAVNYEVTFCAAHFISVSTENDIGYAVRTCNANDAKAFLEHFSDCLFYFCSTCVDAWSRNKINGC